MAMAGAARCGRGAYLAHVASGVGTSQEGEAMILLSLVRRLAVRPGAYWLVPDLEAGVGALRTYQEGGCCGSGSGGSCVAASNRTLRSVIQCRVVTTFMAQVGTKRLPPRTVAYGWCMPSLLFPPPGDLPGPVLAFPRGDWLQEQASILAWVGYEAHWGANYTPGSGLPLD